MEANLTEVTGRLLFRRRLSARLVFYDLVPDGCSEKAFELALKAVRAGKHFGKHQIGSLQQTCAEVKRGCFRENLLASTK